MVRGSRKNDGRVISNFMIQALKGEDLTIYGEGDQTRSFCYVSDEIEGILGLSRSNEHLPVNVGNPVEWTILECAKVVLRVTGSKSKIVYCPLPQDDPLQRQPDISKAKRLVRLGAEDRSGNWPEAEPGLLQKLRRSAGLILYDSRCCLEQPRGTKAEGKDLAGWRNTAGFSWRDIAAW